MASAGRVTERAALFRLAAAADRRTLEDLLPQVAALPDIEGDHGSLDAIPGTIPNLIHPPSGCRFHPRCPRATAICTAEKPAMRPIGADHAVACHHALD